MQPIYLHPDYAVRIHPLMIIGHSSGSANPLDRRIASAIRADPEGQICARLLPAKDLGFGGAPLLSLPWGALPDREMWLSMNRSMPDDGYNRKLERAIDQLARAWWKPPMLYVGYPAAHEDPVFQLIMNRTRRSRLWRFLYGDECEAEFKTRCKACLPQLGGVLKARYVLDCCPGEAGAPPSIADKRPWRWWAELAVELGRERIAGVEPHWNKAEKALHALDSFTLGYTLARIAANMGEGWARTDFEWRSVHVLVAGRYESPPAKQLVHLQHDDGSFYFARLAPSYDDRDLGPDGEPLRLREFCLWALSLGAHVYLNPSWFIAAKRDVGRWLLGA